MEGMNRLNRNIKGRTEKKVFIILTILFAVLSSLSVLAQPVSNEKALAAAQYFYFNEMPKMNSLKSAPSFEIAKIENITASDLLKSGSITPAFFIINIGNEQGFIIISGDERTQPVLGYSASGSFKDQELPEGMVSVLNQFKNEISDIIKADFSNQLPANSKWNKLSNGTTKSGSISSEFHLISTLWGQGKNYNDLCPADPAMTSSAYNGHVPAGCAAVVMSQIMKYWEWPEKGTGSNCYTPSTATYGELCANFEEATYDFQDMPDKATTASPEVAQLVYDAAVAIKTNFSASGSSAFSSATVSAFVNNFRYSDKAEFVLRSNYSDSEWVELLKSQLDHNIPVYYRGDKEGKSAHAFICDGYDQAGRFHFNWGWDGRYDGFFAISAMEPISNYNYNSNQGAIINLIPNNLDFSVEALSAKNQLVEKGEKVELSYTQIYNGSDFTDHEVAYAYWLSSDPTLDENDIMLGKDFSILSAENNEVEKVAAISLNNVEVSNDYYVFVIAESDENTIDVNPSNNTGMVKITVVPNKELVNKSSVTTSVNDFHESDIRVYPNPAKEKIYIGSDKNLDKDVTITLMDMRGILLEKKSVANHGFSEESSFDLSQYADGQYFIGIYSADGSHITKKVMKKA